MPVRGESVHNERHAPFARLACKGVFDMHSPVPLLLIALLLTAAGAYGADDGLVGHWSFDDSLKDASPSNIDVQRDPATFVEGTRGRALDLHGDRAQIPASPVLNLAPGLTLDCWVYFDEKPTGYQHLLYKDEEYQLRVDAESEGGRFAFFVYLEGWEPRIRGPVPEPGVWYHIIARWTGSETSLEVNGRTVTTRRSGLPVPTDNPLTLGAIPGRMDELTITNPQVAIHRAIERQQKAVPDAARTDRTEFGVRTDWDGWRAENGATLTKRAGRLTASFPTNAAMICHPGLDVDVSARKYVSLDIDSPGNETATLIFVTDRGQNSVPFSLWDRDRTTIVNLRSCPQWTGRLKFLAIAFGDSPPNEATVDNLYISEAPAGKPFAYVRNLAPGRAILRTGRDERIIAVIRCPGREIDELQATLSVPEGIEIDGDATQQLGPVPFDGTRRVEWPVRADKPIKGPVTVQLSAEGLQATAATLDVGFEPPVDLPVADYVPEPVPAKSDYTCLMHYCPLWKFGTHYGWGKIEDWPERKPAIGWYDEGTPEVADWHIKYALEHGIQAFIYCWYRSNWGPDVKHSLGHAIHDGLMNARYLDKFKFCIMWENGCAKGVQSPEDMMDNLLPYWMENYFTHPSYLVIDNKPVLFVWRPERVGPELGGTEITRKVFDDMRAECRRRGFDGLHIIGCVGGPDEALLNRMAEEGWDATSAYGLSSAANPPVTRDIEGTPTTPHRDWILGQKETLLAKKRIGALPDIVDVMCGWDPRPWHGKRTNSYYAGLTADAFRQALINAKEIVDATPGNGLDKRLVVLDNWTEFGEGHYIEPTSGEGFAFVDAIRDVFCEGPPPAPNIVPEDVGLETPDRVYRKYQELMAAQPSGASGKATGDLVVAYSFDGDNEHVAFDTSGAGANAFKHGFKSAPGKRGKAFLCEGGAVSVGSRPEFWPIAGITIELWCKPDLAEQSDRWMVNTIGSPNSGYRLGMSGGCVAWQIPVTNWSHLVRCEEPLPLGEWTHVMATYDNDTMRVYINGEEQAQMKRGGGIQPSETTMNIGNYTPEHPTAFFSGLLDEVRIYKRALSPDEVQTRYEQTR